MQKQWIVLKQSVLVMVLFSLLIVLVGCPPVDEPVDTHLVTFHFNNGTENLAIEVIDGEVVERPVEPQKIGHAFLDWYLGDTPYQFNQPVVSDLNVEAKWDLLSYPFKVLDHKGNVLIEENLPYGTYFRNMIPESPFLFGFEFNGYNTNANTMIDEAITIEPVYTAVTDFVQSYTFESKIRKVVSNDFSNAVLLENGDLYMWGHNGSPYLLCGGYDHSYDTLTPTEISGQFHLQANEIIIDIYLGVDGNYAITNQGRFFTWGECFDCNLGLCEDNVEGYPKDVTSYFQIGDEVIKQYFILLNYISIVTESGKIYNSGSYIDESNLTLIDNKEWVDQTSYFNLEPNEDVVKIYKYHQNGTLLTSSGRIFVWGSNRFAELGVDQSIVETEIPIETTSRFNLNPDEKIIDFSVSAMTTTVLTNQGRVFGYGTNASGVLTDIDKTLKIFEPKDLTPDFNLDLAEYIVEIKTGYSFNSIFITNQGRVFALGNNLYNQLSMSDLEYVYQPYEITDAFGFDASYKQWVISRKYIIYVSDQTISISGNRTFELIQD